VDGVSLDGEVEVWQRIADLALGMKEDGWRRNASINLSYRVEYFSALTNECVAVKVLMAISLCT
jgi:hypothetical protein